MIKAIGKDTKDPRKHKVGSFFAINSCIFFSLVGVFPTSTNIVLFVFHGTFALISLLSAIVYLSIFSILIYKSKNFSNFFTYLALITAGTIIVFLLTWNPIIEWIMAFAVTVWITLISAYVLWRKI